jgi:ornithine lipid ester-linked acyl 2-hydroxylase
MRGVLDLSGIKGYRYLAQLGGIFATISLIGFLLTFFESNYLILCALLCSTLAYTELFTIRVLSAEIQRLDTTIWIGIDYYVFKWMFRVTTALNSAAIIGIALDILIYSKYIILFSWLSILVSNIILIVACLLFGGRARTFASQVLAAAQRDGMRRFEMSIVNYLSKSQANPYPIARHLGLCSIAQKPFYEASDFAFLQALKLEYPKIKRELEDVFRQGDGFHTYDVTGAVGEKGWETFFFHKGRQRIPENTERCPETTRVIESIPGYYIRHPVFVLLRPGSSAAPHRDHSNVTLNCHLGLVVPEGDCAIRVGAETRHWEEGKCLIFDTSYEHEVWNFTKQPRIVLQITFFRPEITDDERLWWSEIFSAL